MESNLCDEYDAFFQKHKNSTNNFMLTLKNDLSHILDIADLEKQERNEE